MILQNEIILSEIISQQEITPGIFHIVIHSPTLSQKSLPGQFLMIRIDDTTDPLLRRPFSLCGAEKGQIEVLFQVKGKGTEIMSRWVTGQVINIMGPLGNGFRMPKNLKTAWLIAGGIGVAPLLYLAKHIKRVNENIDLKLYMGGKTAKDVSLLEMFNLNGCDVLVATEDGTKGFQGFVSELFMDHLRRKFSFIKNNHCIFGCGPFPMSKTLANIARINNISCQLSLESHMACGVGACLGCVVNSKNDADFQSSYKRVCVDGPVFDSNEIDWDTLSG